VVTKRGAVTAALFDQPSYLDILTRKEGACVTAVSSPQTASRIVLGGAFVDLRHRDEVVAAVTDRLGGRPPGPRAPLAIGSANLDHVHHFGRRGASAADIDVSGNSPEWLILLDGAPMVRRASSLTGRSWPLLAGSDLLPLLLGAAQAAGARVGFLGGTEHMHDIVRPVLAERYPGLTVAGFWAPARTDLADHTAAAGLADLVRQARTDLLVVGLGKPRQERWIQRHAPASGARVLLAFGAATDFLAGTVSRAPDWARRGGVEWLYRLTREPRRLARRYCVQGPPALWRLWTDSRP
jgi:exopolysaccharide biosynthesis WecB/TagA/CpsF family protein